MGLKARFPKSMTSVVNFGHGTYTCTSRATAAIRHLKAENRKSAQCNTSIFELFLLCSYGLGSTARVYGNHTASTLRSTRRTTRQYCYGSVASNTETWNQHITVGHVEMVGLDALVRLAIEDPYQIRQSTLHPTAYRFEFTDSSTMVGVIVTYTGPILSGSETGKVTTAYPIQPTMYKSNVGAIVWTKPKTKDTP
jgi:hypothetical protein